MLVPLAKKVSSCLELKATDDIYSLLYKSYNIDETKLSGIFLDRGSVIKAMVVASEVNQRGWRSLELVENNEVLSFTLREKDDVICEASNVMNWVMP